MVREKIFVNIYRINSSIRIVTVNSLLIYIAKMPSQKFELNLG